MGWNVKRAAEACGLDASSWSNWERGSNMPRDLYAVVEKIAAATSCDATWLLAGVRTGSLLTPIPGVIEPELPFPITRDLAAVAG